ncbi:MAG: hypothetical protein Q9M23_08020, partial [Mariprofundaceae bacterium]|nr:hypothetical protein [Mariprofundaceae bacterium]
EHPQGWKDAFDAATSLTRLALLGVVPGLKAEALLQTARQSMPAAAIKAGQVLAMDLIRLRARFGFGNQKDTDREIIALRYSLAGQQEQLWQLELLAIEVAWKSGHLSALDQRLDRLRQAISQKHPLQFDVANLKALILHATGRLGAARQAYAAAKSALIYVQAAGVAEREGALHNNLGRLEMDAGHTDAALKYFRSALDMDGRRRDRVGQLFDRKNLGQLLLKLGKNREGIAMLTKAVDAARTLRLAAVQAEATAHVLLVGKTTSVAEALAFRAFVAKHRLHQFDWVAQWLSGDIQRRQGMTVEAEASLRRAMAIVEQEGNAAFASGLLQPIRVYDALIALLYKSQPELAHRIAGRALNWMYGTGVEEEEEEDVATRSAGQESRLFYFSG